MARLRLVKVVCQAHFVLDDGETLIERVAEPVTVPASEWPTYPATAFAAQLAALQTELT